jgi:exosortase/archaeosortase family protein
MVYAIAFAAAAKIVLECLPDFFIEAAFMRPAGWIAASYWGVPLGLSPLAFSVGGVTLEITRACSATDFFAMVASLLAFTLPVKRTVVRIPVAILTAWAVAVSANAARLVVLAKVDALFPPSRIPAVHMAVGMAVFLTVFVFLWYTILQRKESTNERE